VLICGYILSCPSWLKNLTGSGNKEIFDDFLLAYSDKYEHRLGFLRPVIPKVVTKFKVLLFGEFVTESVAFPVPIFPVSP